MVGLAHAATLRIHRDVVTAVALSLDSQTLFSASQDGSFRVHSLVDQQQLHTDHIGMSPISSIVVFHGSPVGAPPPFCTCWFTCAFILPDPGLPV